MLLGFFYDIFASINKCLDLNFLYKYLTKYGFCCNIQEPLLLKNYFRHTIKTINLQPFLNCGYMNTCFKCGQKFLCKGHKDHFSTFGTCIHITAFKTLLYLNNKSIFFSSVWNFYDKQENNYLNVIHFFFQIYNRI